MSAMSDIQTEIELNWTETPTAHGYVHWTYAWLIVSQVGGFVSLYSLDENQKATWVMESTLETAVHYVSLVGLQQV